MTTSNINYFRQIKKVKVMKYNLKIQFELLDLGKMTIGISNSLKNIWYNVIFPFYVSYVKIKLLKQQTPPQ